jgi:hypothetical protein
VRTDTVDSSPMSYGLKLAAVLVMAVVLFVAGIVIFTDVWARVGLGAALLVICGPLLVWAWYLDRKASREREGLEDI